MSDPIELVERQIERVLNRETDSKGIHFFLQVGGRYDERRGIVTLQISGSGWAFVSHRIEEDISTFSCQLSQTHLLKFYDYLLKNPFWRIRISRRKRNPKLDEANIHIRLSDQTKGICNACQCWTTDLKQSKQLRTILTYFEELVKILSDGEIILDLSSTPYPPKSSTKKQ